MNPSKVVREKTFKLTDLPNIGKSIAGDLESIGVMSPKDLEGKNPFELFEKLCETSGQKHDPCLLDVFMSVTDFMNGGEPKVWWKYTDERKKVLSK